MYRTISVPMINIVFPMKMFYFIISKKDRIKWEIWMITFLCVHDTRSQREIFCIFLSQATSLSQREYSLTLVGAKGIGKSTALKILASSMSSIHHIVPNIIPIYVSKLQ